jgi:hypothetical protein
VQFLMLLAAAGYLGPRALDKSRLAILTGSSTAQLARIAELEAQVRDLKAQVARLLGDRQDDQDYQQVLIEHIRSAEGCEDWEHCPLNRRLSGHDRRHLPWKTP